jgi:hypothetical protein
MAARSFITGGIAALPFIIGGNIVALSFTIGGNIVARSRVLLPAAACCCLLLPGAACCCLVLPAAACEVLRGACTTVDTVDGCADRAAPVQVGLFGDQQQKKD